MICENCNKEAYYKDLVTMKTGKTVKTFYYCKQHGDEFVQFGVVEKEELEKL